MALEEHRAAVLSIADRIIFRSPVKSMNRDAPLAVTAGGVLDRLDLEQGVGRLLEDLLGLLLDLRRSALRPEQAARNRRRDRHP